MLTRNNFVDLISMLDFSWDNGEMIWHTLDVVSDWLQEHGEEEMSEGLLWLKDNKKYPHRNNSQYYWNLSIYYISSTYLPPVFKGMHVTVCNSFGRAFLQPLIFWKEHRDRIFLELLEENNVNS